MALNKYTYTIHSPTYGTHNILLDKRMYYTLKKFGFNIFIKKTETPDRFYYIVRTRSVNKKRYYYYLHRLVCNYSGNLTIDHINHNTLDNRRCNLKICTQAEDNLNRRKRGNNGLRK